MKLRNKFTRKNFEKISQENIGALETITTLGGSCFGVCLAVTAKDFGGELIDSNLFWSALSAASVYRSSFGGYVFGKSAKEGTNYIVKKLNSVKRKKPTLEVLQ